MMTTGTVGGCSCGRAVSSRRGMAAAWARAGTEGEWQKCEERSRHFCHRLSDIQLISRGPFLLLSPHWFHVSGSDYLNRFKPACCLLCLPMLLLSHVSLDPVSIQRHQLTPTDTDTERGKKLLFILLLCFHTQPWTLPVCLGLHTRGNTPPQHNVPPAFLFAVPPTSTHPLSYHTWPAARLASVNPGAASQTKGSSNQIYVGLGLLWNVAVEHV